MSWTVNHRRCLLLTRERILYGVSSLRRLNKSRLINFRIYNFAVGSGVSVGIIISGFITINNSWRVIYLVGSVLIGILLLLIFFTFPETAYNRSYADSEDGDIVFDPRKPYRLSLSIILEDTEKARLERYYAKQDREAGLETNYEQTAIEKMEERIRRLEAAVLGKQQYEALESFQPKKKSYWSTLAFFNKETYTTDSMWKMFVRPFGLILLPPVFWATTIMAVTVGFSVAISSACKLPPPLD